MRNYVSEKIEQCRVELLQALDRNDYLSAIKLRAVQKEFEDLLNAHDDATNERTNAINATEIELQKYYTTKEAAAKLDLHPSSVTRNAAFLHGEKVRGRWHFPKEIIDRQSIKTRNRIKPGKKPQS